MTSAPRRTLNDAVTRFWSIAAPLYDQPFLQQWVYRPAQDEVIAALHDSGARRVADIACGTGILAARIENELDPDEVYGVDMSDGMLAQAKARSSDVQWRKGPAEHLPFEDGALDAVVTTSAFHFFDQPAALREFRRVLAPGGLAAVATLSPRQVLPLHRLSAKRRRGRAHKSRPIKRHLKGPESQGRRSDRREYWYRIGQRHGGAVRFRSIRIAGRRHGNASQALNIVRRGIVTPIVDPTYRAVSVVHSIHRPHHTQIDRSRHRHLELLHVSGPQRGGFRKNCHGDI